MEFSMCMSTTSKCKVRRSLGSTPCPGLSHGGFVAIISISLVIQFSGFSKHLLSGWHFWKFNIFFDFGKWCMHINWMEVQYF
jgi:hypothetical protein